MIHDVEVHEYGDDDHHMKWYVMLVMDGDDIHEAGDDDDDQRDLPSWDFPISFRLQATNQLVSPLRQLTTKT